MRRLGRCGAASCALALVCAAAALASTPHSALTSRVVHGYGSLTLVAGRLLLAGANAPLISSRFAAPGTSRCAVADVDPVTLAVSDRRTGACDDPRLYGLRTLVINDYFNGNPQGSRIRIAHVTPGGGWTLGPVVMTYTELSDTNAEWVYGDGFLWLYDPETTRGSVLLRISQTSGAVLQTIRMPWIDRPLIATDADGFWLAPAPNSGGDPPSVAGLYRVAPGARRPVRVSATGYDCYWMLASGHSVWIAVNHDPRSPTLLRFDATSATPVVRVTSHSAFGFGEFGYGEPSYAGGAVQGIWTIRPQLPSRLSQQVIRIDPDSGRATAVASYLPRGVNAYAPTPVVALRNSLYFLEDGAVYRVTPG